MRTTNHPERLRGFFAVNPRAIASTPFRLRRAGMKM